MGCYGWAGWGNQSGPNEEGFGEGEDEEFR